jgi:hypothetical protein
MNKRQSVQFLLLPSVIVLLLASILHQAPSDHSKSNVTISKDQAPDPHAHFHEVLVKLAAAKNGLMYSSSHGSYTVKKGEILAEIASCFKITRETADIHTPLRANDEMLIINGTVKSLQAALDESSRIEDGILSSHDKEDLKDHIQVALDKALQIQQAEQKSQPEKSSP